MRALMKFLEKGAKSPRSGGQNITSLDDLLMKLGGSGPQNVLPNVGRSGGRAVGGFEAATGLNPKTAALAGGGAGAAAGGYGLSELMEEDDDPLKQLLAAIGLG